MDLHDIRDELLNLLGKRGARGCNGLLEDQRYLPRKFLDEFWSQEKINKLLSKAGSRVPDGFVARDYLSVFSVLLYLNKTHHLSEFVRRQLDDSNLPLQSQVWPYETGPLYYIDFEVTIRAFYDSQWPFCALEIPGDSAIHKRVLHPLHILPFSAKRRALSMSSEVAAVYEVAVDSIDQRAEEAKGPETFALKVFSSDQKQAFENEANIFAGLTKTSSDLVVQYYGSFIQGDTYNLILENANGGTLSEFFRIIPPPPVEEEIRSFWEGIFNVASTLEKLHCISDRNIGSWGRHGDIKPQNILWFKDGAESKQLCFKVADFGVANVANVQPGPTKTTRRSYHPTIQGVMHHREERTPKHAIHPVWGNEKHSAAKAQQTTGQDIWSLGCLLLECSVWVIKGHEELKRFRQSRRDELTRKAIKYDDRWPAFHAGSGRLLSSVEGMFEDLRLSQLEGHHDKEDGCDSITWRILDMLQKEMLVPRNKDGRIIRTTDMLKVFRRVDDTETETDGYGDMGQNDWGLDMNKRVVVCKKNNEERMGWGYTARTTSSLLGY